MRPCESISSERSAMRGARLPRGRGEDAVGARKKILESVQEQLGATSRVPTGSNPAEVLLDSAPDRLVFEPGRLSAHGLKVVPLQTEAGVGGFESGHLVKGTR